MKRCVERMCNASHLPQMHRVSSRKNDDVISNK